MANLYLPHEKCSIDSPGRNKFPAAVTVGSMLGGRFWGARELRKTLEGGCPAS